MTVREHVETHRAAGYGTEAIWKLWKEGQLLPADEVEARIAEAVAAERERVARMVETCPKLWIQEQFVKDVLAAAIRGGNHDG